MRLLIDTNIFIYMAIDKDSLSDDVVSLIEDYTNTLYVSVETIRELIVNFNNGGIVSHRWKTSSEMIESLKNDYLITILPLPEEVMFTYSHLQLNDGQDYRDPSDHVIISHAITLRIPLISSDRKFPYYRNQGLDLIENKK